jgi:transcription initiation factor TFIID subunit 1
LTSNALLAAEGRLMLQVTGAGEGRINFLRDKRDENPGKGTRPRSGESLIQHKQKLQQVWRSMQAALSVRAKDPRAYPPNEAKDPLVYPPSELAEEDEKSVYSATTSTAGRKLVISRVRTDPQGTRISITESITDARVISQYLWKQQELAVRKKRRMNANKASQAPKKKARKESVLAKKPKEQANVRCGACGAYGHMRTNRICPMFNSLQNKDENNSSNSNNGEEAPVKVEGGKITITIDSLKRAAEERSRTLMFKLPTKVLSSSGTSTPPAKPVQKKPAVVIKRKKLAPWQRIMEELPQHKPDLEAFNQGLSIIIASLKAEADSWPFHRPVNKRQYPVYYKIIQKPVDLQTIGMAASKCKYTSREEFLERIELMARNCRQYNGEEHAFSMTAQRLLVMAREGCERLAELEVKLSEALLKKTQVKVEEVEEEGVEEVEEIEVEEEVMVEDEIQKVE